MNNPLNQIGLEDLGRHGLLLLREVRPADPQASRAEQARSVLEQIDAWLRGQGLDFRHVVRTWFFLADILDWYGEFNEVRTDFFRARGILDRWPPASTGVGVVDLGGAALVGAALVVRSLNNGTVAEPVASPLQCEATAYASSFSRAVEVRAHGLRHLFVSGTASIDEEGRSAYRGDVERQIELTLAVVDGLLASRGLEWTQVGRAVGYFRDPADLPRLGPHLASLGVPSQAVRLLPATICRDDLLFELELDAVAADDAAAPAAP